MAGLAERISTEHKGLQADPPRAAHLIRLFAGNAADNWRTRMVTFEPVTEALIKFGEYLPGVIFMACQWPRSKSKTERPPRKEKGFFIDPVFGYLRRGHKDRATDSKGNTRPVFIEELSGQIFERELKGSDGKKQKRKKKR